MNGPQITFPPTAAGAASRSPAAYAQALRALRANPPADARPLRTVVLSTFSANLLEPFIAVEAAERGFLLDLQFGPFGHLEQAALADGPLWQPLADVVIVAAQLEDLSPVLAGSPLALDAAGADGALAVLETRIADLLSLLRRRSTAKLLVANFAARPWPLAGIADAMLQPSQALLCARANAALAAACARLPDAAVLDWAQYAARLGDWRDERLALLARNPLSASAQRAFGEAAARHIRALYTPPRKCLVLDLDNTLWGGIVGEDGYDGIQLGEDLPGSAFKAFQRQALELTRRGILLAVCSKNNPDDALAVLERHPDCLLRPENFAALRINWQDKASNIRSIAEELSLGLDAFAFYDDNPVERDWVRRELPMVAVFEPPASAMGYAAQLAASEWFDQLVVSAEDRARVALYRVDRERRDVQASHASLDDFLRDLDMTVTVGTVGEANAARVGQLVAKTNQFNLTTRRRSAAEIAAMVERGGVALWVRVRDRFGDNGLVGVVAAAPSATPGEWDVDLFLLSCRVIGRKVEDMLLALLGQKARAAGAARLVGEYVASRRNAMVADFYARRGFAPLDGDGRRWAWDFAAQGDLPTSDLVQIEWQN